MQMLSLIIFLSSTEALLGAVFCFLMMFLVSYMYATLAVGKSSQSNILYNMVLHLLVK